MRKRVVAGDLILIRHRCIAGCIWMSGVEGTCLRVWRRCAVEPERHIVIHEDAVLAAPELREAFALAQCIEESVRAEIFAQTVSDAMETIARVISIFPAAVETELRQDINAVGRKRTGEKLMIAGISERTVANIEAVEAVLVEDYVTQLMSE